MNLRHQRIWITLWLGLLLGLLPGAVQGANRPPAYLTLDGDLYQWSPGEAAPQPVTACPMNGQKILTLALSPDGTHLALNVISPDIFYGGYAPSPTGNLWVCDLVQGTVIALTDIDPVRQMISFRGVWSPDGTLLAWGAINADYRSTALLTYDVNSAATRPIVANTPLSYGCGVGPYPPVIAWNETGIAVATFTGEAKDPCTAQSVGVRVYAADGSPIADLKAAGAGSEPIEQVVWDSEAQDRLIFRLVGSEKWQTITLDGTVTATHSTLQQTAPGGGAVTWVGTGEGWFHPRLALSGLPSDQVLETSEDAQRVEVAFAPDGSGALFAFQTAVYAAEKGNLLLVVPPQQDVPFIFPILSWGTPAQYHLVDPPAPTCPAVDALYYPDSVAQVIPGTGDNNQRDFPLRSAAKVGVIPEGALAESVLYNAICSGGIRWRSVAYQGQVGWTAEAQDDTYFLQVPPG